jgi:hypothetical protein
MHKTALMFSLGLLLSAAAMPSAQAQLFGPSDEEKAHEADQDSKLSDLAGQIQQLQGRVQALEDQARSLTKPPAPMKSCATRSIFWVKRSTSSRRIFPTGSAWFRRSSWAPAEAIRA